MGPINRKVRQGFAFEMLYFSKHGIKRVQGIRAYLLICLLILKNFYNSENRSVR